MPLRATWSSALPPFKILSIAFAAGWLVLTALKRQGGNHERSVVPDALGLLAAVGVLPPAFANLTWHQGLRRGDVQLLAVRAYARPLGGALILGFFSVAALTPTLVVGGLAIAGTGPISR